MHRPFDGFSCRQTTNSTNHSTYPCTPSGKVWCDVKRTILRFIRSARFLNLPLSVGADIIRPDCGAMWASPPTRK